LIDSARTAIYRSKPSKPCRLALEREIIVPGDSVLDYGCGRGFDVLYLNSLGIKTDGYDPAFAPIKMRADYDVVLLSYVLNVIENPYERAAALRLAWRRSSRSLLLTVRTDWKRITSYPRRNDGFVTSIGTWQTYLTDPQLLYLIFTNTTGVPCRLARGMYLVERE